MKFSIAGILAFVATGMAVLSCLAQTAAPASPAPAEASQPASQTAPEQSRGKVLFSRSTDENGQTTTQVGISTTKSSVVTADAPVADDAERHAVTFTNLDLDVRLRTVEQHIAVRAQLTVRNDGQTPLARIPLQISSTLQWERIRVAGTGGQLKDVVFPVALLKSDVDHTGQLNEAAVPLSQPLAPGGTVQLDVTYSGDIPASAQRLDVIDTPTDVALHSNWDQISVPFTGLRGFGNVAWYPVSSVPAFLGEGARLFDEIGSHKLRLSGRISGSGSPLSFRTGRRLPSLSSTDILRHSRSQIPALRRRNRRLAGNQPAWPSPTRARTFSALRRPACFLRSARRIPATMPHFSRCPRTNRPWGPGPRLRPALCHS
jgi:hypothetical protein